MIRPFRGIVFAACLSAWAFAAATAHADEAEPLSFHCGKTFITFYRGFVWDTGRESMLPSNAIITMRKTDISVILSAADGTLSFINEDGNVAIGRPDQHRAIVECLD